MIEYNLITDAEPCGARFFINDFHLIHLKSGVADLIYEIHFERRAERASQNEFHSRIKQCLKRQVASG